MGTGARMQHGKIRIGLSGWSYRHWRGDFYPPGLAVRAELNFALDHFSTLELNRTFYSLVTPAAYRRWYEASPPGFRWAVKGSRVITHNKKLAGVEGPLANFLSSGILELREKLGPILWQLSPSLRPDLDRLDRFLRLLPTDTDQAAAIAAEHTMKERETFVETDRIRPVRHVLEVRHPGWFVPEVADIARPIGLRLPSPTPHGGRMPRNLRLISSTFACTDPTNSTPAPTAPKSCAGGPRASSNGRPVSVREMSMSTSTTTPADSPPARHCSSKAWCTAASSPRNQG